MGLTQADAALMAQIDGLEIDPPGAALRFSDRLARENAWTRDYAAHVVREYRRFLFLAATAPHAVTPSDAVDQAWHLHLAYTRSYWNDLCAGIIGRPLHHGPTAGGATEDSRYREQYAATLATYRTAFREDAPCDIWPPVAERFAGRFERVDRSRSWVVPKVPLAPLAAVPLLAGCVTLAANASGSSFPPGLSFGLLGLLGVVIVTFAILAVSASRDEKSNKDKKDGGCGSSGCGSGSSDRDGGSDSDGGSDGASGCGGGGCGGD